MTSDSTAIEQELIPMVTSCLWMRHFSLYHITLAIAYCFDKELTLQGIIHFKNGCSSGGAQLTALLYRKCR